MSVCRIRILCVVCMAGWSGCSVSRSVLDRQIYRTVVEDFIGQKVKTDVDWRGVRLLVICSRPYPGPELDEDFPFVVAPEKRLAVLRKGLPALREDTYQDFVARNAKPGTLHIDSTQAFEVRMISRAEVSRMFEVVDAPGVDAVDEAWKAFHASHPGAQGIMRLSAVGIGGGTQALIYCGNQQGGLSGGGGYILLDREGGSWDIAGYYHTWSS